MLRAAAPGFKGRVQSGSDRVVSTLLPPALVIPGQSRQVTVFAFHRADVPGPGTLAATSRSEFQRFLVICDKLQGSSVDAGTRRRICTRRRTCGSGKQLAGDSIIDPPAVCMRASETATEGVVQP